MKTDDELTIEFLVNYHGYETVKKWINNLTIFYLYKSAGGLLDDNGEDFRTPIKYTDLDDLKSKLMQIGLVLHEIPANSPKPEKGKSYTSKEYMQFKSIINKHSNYEQPGHVMIFRQKCFIWVYEDYFLISISGNGDEKHRNSWTVDNSDYEICKELDLALEGIEWSRHVKRELESDRRYISRNRYSELLK